MTLVDRNGREIEDASRTDETFAEYAASPDLQGARTGLAPARDGHRRQMAAFVVVSAGCAAAAVASGTYAFWLSRRRLAEDALSSVHGILETCRESVTRMEQELNQLNATTSH